MGDRSWGDLNGGLVSSSFHDAIWRHVERSRSHILVALEWFEFAQGFT